MWLSLLPLGLGAWAPAVAGHRCGVRRWTMFGLLCGAAGFAGWVLAAIDAHTNLAGLAVVLMLGAWLAGALTSFAIRPAYEDLIDGTPHRSDPWPQPTGRSRTWTVRYAVAAFVITFAGDFLLGVLLRHLFGVHLKVGVGVLIVDATLLGSLLPVARGRGLSLSDLGVRAAPSMRSLGLVLLVLLAYALAAAVYAALFIGHSARHSADLLSGVRHLGTVLTVVTVVAVAVSAPVVEETFFRGLLYRSLRNRLPVPRAALIGGVLFGFVHIIGYPLITVPVKMLFGILACLLYERTGSLIPGIAVHSFVDASAVDLALTGNDDIVLVCFGALIVGLVLRWAFQSLTRPLPSGTAAEAPA
ncbi:MAG: lysostaphin resistance A-like protein [Solirubrobacteraceae bacterium]